MLPPVRLAYFSPLPPAHTGVADYSAGLLPFLREQMAITLFTENPAGVDPHIQENYSLQPLDQYPAQRLHFNTALYHIGNNQHHEAIYDLALRYPGVVMLHDYYLHPYLADRAARENNFPAYARELAYAQGPAGVQLGWQVQTGGIPRPDHAFPLNDRLIDLSLGVIVHSRTLADDIRRRRPEARVAVIPHFVHRHSATSRRTALSWPEDAVIIGHCGYLTANRQLPLVLETFAQLQKSLPHIRLLIVGEVVNQEVDVRSLIAKFGLAEVVHVTGFIPDQQTFLQWMATADFLVNLRQPTMGETSGTTLLAFALARPVVLFAHGWYGELPDEVCAKVPVMDQEALRQVMHALATRPDLRQEMGQQAQAYAHEVGDPAQIAGNYMQSIERFLLRPTTPTTHSPAE